MKTKAFTLIELLVVIAIIGILATVVIASLNSARTKGRHASIKANLRNAVSQSIIYFNDNGTYTGLCSDPTIVSILSALGGTGSAACFAPDVSSPSGVNLLKDLDWGIAATFNGVHFTADPRGVLQLDTANTGSTHTWDAAMASCASAGKRIAGGSAFKALYGVTNSIPVGFTSGNYWTSTEHPTSMSVAYDSGLSTGTFSDTSKSVSRYLRCGS